MERRDRRNLEIADAIVKAEEAEFKRQRLVQEIGYNAIERHMVSRNPDERWQDRALCMQVGYELFFLEKGETSTDAKKVCGRCQVRQDCLEAALNDPDTDGIWGGTTERERRKMRKQRRNEYQETA